MTNKIWELSTPPQITAIGAETGILPQMIDLFSVFNAGDIAAVELEILTGATPPGAARTVTLFAAFCSRSDRTPAQLLTNSENVICALPNSANQIRVYSLPVFQQGARYLYLWFDHTAMDAGSVLTVTPVVNAKTS